MTTKPLRVAIYARTSTEDQHPENQIQDLREFAQRCGYEVVGEYTDYISGAKQSRPQLDLLMQDGRMKMFEAVLCWKLDRLGRSLQHLIHIISEWENLGIGLICKTQDINTTTASGKLIFHIFGAIAEFERELISERQRLSIQARKRAGKPVGRQRGARDKKPRKKGGYIARYMNKTPEQRKLGKR